MAQIGLTRPEGRDKFRSRLDPEIRREHGPDVSALWKQLRDACPDINVENPEMLATFLEGLWVGASMVSRYTDSVMAHLLSLIADGLDLVDALEAEVPDRMP